jgi:AbrB family looped-hinge helix DNA binding protein
LPAALRHQLGLNSGDRLDVELVEGTIVLRPAAKTRHRAPGEDQKVATDSPTPDVPETLTLTDTAPARRKPGRLRKRDAAGELDPAATPKRPRGRPKAARVSQPEPAPSVQSVPSLGSCGARWTCNRRQRALRMPLRRVPLLLELQARRVHRRWSAGRSATSRCASLGRGADTTDRKHFPGPLACPLKRRTERRPPGPPCGR